MELAFNHKLGCNDVHARFILMAKITITNRVFTKIAHFFELTQWEVYQFFRFEEGLCKIVA